MIAQNMLFKAMMCAFEYASSATQMFSLTWNLFKYRTSSEICSSLYFDRTWLLLRWAAVWRRQYIYMHWLNTNINFKLVEEH